MTGYFVNEIFKREKAGGTKMPWIKTAVCDDIQKELEKSGLVCVDGTYRVRISNIVFMESQSHYLLTTLSSGEILKLRMNLSQMSEEMQKYPGFIKVGVSYIVNLAFVRRISGQTAEMSNGARISIPRRSSEQVQKLYMDFCRKEVLG